MWFIWQIITIYRLKHWQNGFKGWKMLSTTTWGHRCLIVDNLCCRFSSFKWIWKCSLTIFLLQMEDDLAKSSISIVVVPFPIKPWYKTNGNDCSILLFPLPLCCEKDSRNPGILKFTTRKTSGKSALFQRKSFNNGYDDRIWLFEFL